MKILVIGCGKVGEKLAQQLSGEGNEVTVIDKREDRLLDIVNEYDVMGVVGNGASRKILAEAGIEDVDIAIAVTGSDELNLLCCLIAKKAGGCQTIARVRNPEYSSELNWIKEELGLAMVINPEHTAAMEIARVLRVPSAIKIESFAKGRVELLKFRISEGSILDDMVIMDIPKRLRCDILICAIERGGEVIIPRGQFVLHARDVISIIASPVSSGEFFGRIGVNTDQVHDCMIAGGGAIAFYLAKQLTEMHISVKIIERDLERCNQLCDQLDGAVIIHGDASDKELLMEEGLEHTESFVALTSIDEENIMLSLYAKMKSNAKCITKVNRIKFDDVIDTLDLDTVVFPKSITADYIVRYVRAMKNSIGSNVETMYRIIEGKAEALEFVIKKNSPVVGIPIADMKIRGNIIIACITRNMRSFIPRGHDTIEVGDSVIVVTTRKGVDDISGILER